MPRQVFSYCSDVSAAAALGTHTDVLSGSFPAPLLLGFLLFIEVQVTVLSWLNSVEDRNRWLNLKMAFLKLQSGEMWLLGHKWKPRLGLCLPLSAQVLGAQGVVAGAGCALWHLQPKAAGQSCCLGWEL